MIPPVAHFVWYGNELPWVYALAVKSAARRGDFERVVLHHRDDLSGGAAWRELSPLGKVEVRRLDEETLLRAAWSRELAGICRGLTSYAAKSDLIRAALLYTEGGVYLDLDTITLRSLAPLRQASVAFLGQERIVYPYWVRRSGNPLILISAWLKDALRYAFRLLPSGYRCFPRLEPWYHLAANGAILAAIPGHPFVARLLEAIVMVPEDKRQVHSSLGPHVLQKTLESYQGEDIKVLAPEYFYPLGPVISEHWFRLRNKRPLHEVVTPRTLVVHWYASGANRGMIRQIDAHYVRTHAAQQLFSKLALPFLDP